VGTERLVVAFPPAGTVGVLGSNEQEALDGRPLQLNATDPLKPACDCTVHLDDAVPPGEVVSAWGVQLNANAGAGRVAPVVEGDVGRVVDESDVVDASAVVVAVVVTASLVATPGANVVITDAVVATVVVDVVVAAPVTSAAAVSRALPLDVCVRSHVVRNRPSGGRCVLNAKLRR
jgi:hypothetical protein